MSAARLLSLLIGCSLTHSAFAQTVVIEDPMALNTSPTESVEYTYTVDDTRVNARNLDELQVIPEGTPIMTSEAASARQSIHARTLTLDSHSRARLSGSVRGLGMDAYQFQAQAGDQVEILAEKGRGLQFGIFNPEMGMRFDSYQTLPVSGTYELRIVNDRQNAAHDRTPRPYQLTFALTPAGGMRTEPAPAMVVAAEPAPEIIITPAPVTVAAEPAPMVSAPAPTPVAKPMPAIPMQTPPPVPAKHTTPPTITVSEPQLQPYQCVTGTLAAEIRPYHSMVIKHQNTTYYLSYDPANSSEDTSLYSDDDYTVEVLNKDGTIFSLTGKDTPEGDALVYYCTRR